MSTHWLLFKLASTENPTNRTVLVIVNKKFLRFTEFLKFLFKFLFSESIPYEHLNNVTCSRNDKTEKFFILFKKNIHSLTNR
jgi:hypothetical protein